MHLPIEHPKGLPLVAFKFADGKVLEAAEVKKLAALSRAHFLEAALPQVANRK